MSKDIFDEAYFRGVGSGYKEGYETMRRQIDTFIWPLILRSHPIVPGMRVLDTARKETRATLYVHDVDKGLPMFSDEYFDLVTMIHVIEHLDSPYNVLKEIHRILKPGGKLIILTPNLNSLVRYLLKVMKKEHEWYGFMDITHKYLFTPASLKFLVERAGFRVITVTAPFMSLKRLPIVDKLGFGGSILLVARKE